MEGRTWKDGGKDMQTEGVGGGRMGGSVKQSITLDLFILKVCSF